jgi:hypothetical protein
LGLILALVSGCHPGAKNEEVTPSAPPIIEATDDAPLADLIEEPIDPSNNLDTSLVSPDIVLPEEESDEEQTPTEQSENDATASDATSKDLDAEAPEEVLTSSRQSLSPGIVFLDAYDEIVALPDGFAVAGRYVAKLDEQGNEIWKDDLIGGNDLAFTSDIIVLSNGDIVACEPNSVKRYSDSGEVLFSKRIEGLKAAAPADDGGFVLCGGSHVPETIDSSLSPKGFNDIFVLKFTESNEVEWAKAFGSFGEDIPFSVQKAPGGYVLAGSFGGNNGDFSDFSFYGDYADAFIMTLDNSGNLTNFNSYGSIGQDTPYSVTDTGNGFLSVGYSSAETIEIHGVSKVATGIRTGVIVKFDYDCNPEWFELVGWQGIAELKDAVVYNGNAFILGETDDFSSNALSIENVPKKAKSVEAFVISCSLATGELNGFSSYTGTNADFAPGMCLYGDSVVIVGRTVSGSLAIRGNQTNNSGHHGFLAIEPVSSILFK